MNRWEFTGRLTRNPEIRYTDGETPIAIARFSVAVDKKFRRGNESADFFEIKAFGRLAEFAEKYLTQGTKILASCRIENNNYTRRDGSKAYTFSFIAEEIEFCESKSAADRRKSASGDGFMDLPDHGPDEVPYE